ncbi:hypothetical protein ACEWY4_022901 [Coilia grayii]|uniref:Ig-like domain-containing protein n=1 Tax=Coilia grayii TaxID=363190 RepID=A0ABD1J505_9TELE
MDVWWLMRTLPFLALLSPSSSLAASRTEYFEVGKDVHLSCNNVTWTDALYYIWKINITGVQCITSEGVSKPKYNNCTGGKVLRTTMRGESYLHIPSFTLRDEGMYTCETAYRGGAYKAIIRVVATVRPVLIGKLERDGGQLFAVCSAVVRRPEVEVLWKEMWGSLEVKRRLTPNTDGTVTIESWLHLPDDITKDSLTCVANHPSWTQEVSITIDIAEPPADPFAAELQHVIILSSLIVLSVVIITTLSTYMCLQGKNHGK